MNPSLQLPPRVIVFRRLAIASVAFAVLKVNNVLDDVIFITEKSQWPLRRAFLSFSARF